MNTLRFLWCQSVKYNREDRRKLLKLVIRISDERKDKVDIAYQLGIKYALETANNVISEIQRNNRIFLDHCFSIDKRKN